MTQRTLQVLDMHTAGEPVRIVEAGYPPLMGTTILQKRKDAQTRFDHLRRALMLEPRGHAGMYGVIPTEACDPSAAFGVLFTHQEGYSTMCGHATIAIGRWAVESGRVLAICGEATFSLETPCGVVQVDVRPSKNGPPITSFVSVPSFASHLDQRIDVPGLGTVHLDIAFGGAYYAILPSSRIGLPFMSTQVDRLVRAGVDITNAVRKAVDIRHPHEVDLSFLYGTILTDDVALGGVLPSYNLCIFAEGQIDRSPTGSGVTARLALAAARKQLAVGQPCDIRGISGQVFTSALVVAEPSPLGVMSRVRVGGQAFYAARSEFLLEDADPFAFGFVLPERFSELQNRKG